MDIRYFDALVDLVGIEFNSDHEMLAFLEYLASLDTFLDRISSGDTRRVLLDLFQEFCSMR